MVQGQPEQIVHETPICKITKTKWTGGVAQAGEHLLCKHEALISNSSPREGEREKERERQKENMQYLSFSFSAWLTLFNMMTSNSIHFHTNEIISFFMTESYSIVSMYYRFFIHSAVDGLIHQTMVLFHGLATVNSDAMNMGI
jgi:hypothetical protein